MFNRFVEAGVAMNDAVTLPQRQKMSGGSYPWSMSLELLIMPDANRRSETCSPTYAAERTYGYSRAQNPVAKPGTIQ